jgi:hypothetical protein
MRKGLLGEQGAAYAGGSIPQGGYASGGGVDHLGGGYHHTGAPYFVPGGLPSSKFFLANGDGLYGDYGQTGAANGEQCSRNAAHTVAAIQLPRLPATRDLETNPNPHPPRIVNQMAANHAGGYRPSAPAGNVGGVSYTQTSAPVYGSAPHHHTGNSASQVAYERQQGAHYGGGGGLNYHSARPNYGQGRQNDHIAHEVKPLPGVRYPRTSIGAGHPAGPLGNLVEVRYRGDNTDLSPLLPCTYPPQQYVNNPEDRDQYHRTSVYAASGLPIDMAAWASPGAWKERVQHQRV